MSRKRVIHIFGRSIFLRYYLPFIKKNFSEMEHIFLIYGRDAHSNYVSYPEYNNDFTFIDIGLTINSSYILNPKIVLSHKFRCLIKNSDIVIAHALHTQAINLLLLYPYLLKKTFWLVWGEEFNYRYKKNSQNSFIKEYVLRVISTLRYYLNKVVMSKIKYVSTSSVEFKIIKKYYNPHVHLIDGVTSYPVCYPLPVPKRLDDTETTYILLGHSGWSIFNHKGALDMISKYKDENIRIYIPLSYGDSNYINEVINYADAIFGDKVKILSDFMDPDDYNRLLSQMDVCLFNEPVQTGITTISTLLYYGKKIYLDDSGANIKIFNEWSYIVYPISEIENESFSEFRYNNPEFANYNIELAKKNLNIDESVTAWKRIFDIYQ